MSSRSKIPAGSSGNNEKKPREERKIKQPVLYAFSVILLIVIVVTFVGSGALAQGFGGGSRAVFGRYAGRSIEVTPGNYMARTRDFIGQQYRQLAPDAATEDLLYQIWLQAYNQTLTHTAIMIAAERSGVAVSTERVNEAIARWPQFQEGGEFSQDRYNATSSQEIYSLRSYLREDLVDSKFRDDILYGHKRSPAEVEFFVDMAEPMRSFNYVNFPYQRYPDEEVLSFAEENRRLFQRANLSRITIPDSEQEAEEILAQITDRTSSFESLAQAHSTDIYSSSGGDMGWTFLYELEPDFDTEDPVNAIFDLEPGEVTGVLESSFGYVIYQMDEGPEEADLEDEETLSTVRSYILSFERGRVEDYMLARAEEFRESAAQAGFDEAAIQTDFPTGITAAFPINYGNISFLPRARVDEATNLSNAATREAFFEEAFSISGDDLSEPVVLRDYVIVLQVNEERRPTEEELETIRSDASQFVESARAQQAQNVLIDQDLHENNFNRAFQRFVLGE